MSQSRKKPKKSIATREETEVGLLGAILTKYAGAAGAVIPILQESQEALGCLRPQTIETLALGMGVPASQIYGVVTFYSQFRLMPIGKHLCKVCHGTACHVSGATEVGEAILDQLRVDEGGTTADGRFTVQSVACLGCCSLAPVMMIDEETHGRLTPDRARKLLREV
ncbi:MAG: NADH-quinone oxidoreductase subunit NuoE [Coprothermobacterota bacterium]|nr:NADH-quinone oxidoreductase subunit NuoE [Coprothermobacterota bacterium]